MQDFPSSNSICSQLTFFLKFYTSNTYSQYQLQFPLKKDNFCFRVQNCSLRYYLFRGASFNFQGGAWKLVGAFCFRRRGWRNCSLFVTFCYILFLFRFVSFFLFCLFLDAIHLPTVSQDHLIIKSYLYIRLAAYGHYQYPINSTHNNLDNLNLAN